MDVMDGGADNSSPLIKPPSYRYDLRSKGLRMKYAVLAVIATQALLVGLRRFGEASLGRKPDR
jgi:hypothetical protein